MNKDFFAKLAVTMALLAHTPNIFSEIPTGNVNSKALHDVTYQRLKAEVQNRLVNTWCSSEKAGLIMDLIVSEKLKTCVEIGVFTGSSFLPIASSIQYLSQGHVYAIDAWSNAEAIKYMDDEDPNKNWWACVDMRQAHSFFQNIAQPFERYCIELHCTSEDAVHQIGDIDFLHLDGNYTLEGSLKDAFLYSDKVNVGGYILVSNAHICINQDLPKLDLLYYLAEFCETVRVVDVGNTILYRKMKDSPEG